MVNTELLDARKNHDAIHQAMKNLAKVIGFEDSNKGGRDFAIVMQAAIGLTFLDGEEDV